MQRVDVEEILDSGKCPFRDAQGALAVLGRINRWFGGIATTQKMVERVADVTDAKNFSMLDVAAGLGEVPEQVRARLAGLGITLDITLLDRTPAHLPVKIHGNGNHPPRPLRIVADALALPFDDGAFDIVSCSLFIHHLDKHSLAHFVREGLRVSRRALLINDLIRSPLHLALVFASLPIMRNRIAWLDGLTSVRRAYIPAEIHTLLASILSPQVKSEFSSNYLYRMGVIVWKSGFNPATAEEEIAFEAPVAMPGFRATV